MGGGFPIGATSGRREVVAFFDSTRGQSARHDGRHRGHEAPRRGRLPPGWPRRVAERALNAEMDHHLAGDEGGNSRNGYGRKMVMTEPGRLELEIPRDRQATFDPQLIAKYRRRFPGFDDKLVLMYACGMSAWDPKGNAKL